MKETKTIYSCDICKKEVNEDKELLSLNLPFETYIDTTISWVSWKPSGKCSCLNVEVCQQCALEIHNRIKEFVLIEDIPYSGMQITKRGE